jgi:hypothetical protein
MDPAKLREGLRKAGLYVAEGDPVLELAAICEVSLADTVKVIERVTTQQADRVTLASTASVEAAKKQAELIVTKAGEWAATQIKTAASEAAALVIADIRAEAAGVRVASRVAVRAAWATAFCALVVVAGLAGIVLSRLTHG